MGVFAVGHDYAGGSAQPCRANDRDQTRRADSRRRRFGFCTYLIFILFTVPLYADTIRVGIFHTELERKAPGLLYRDILRNEDDTDAAIARVAQANCDVIVLLDFDYDHHLLTLKAFAQAVRDTGGPDYFVQYALRPNTGTPSYIDLNMDGRLGTPKDAQGYGWFSGQGGMAVLSRSPINAAAVENHSNDLWAEFA